MRNVVCPHCQQIAPVPDDSMKAHCARCGQIFERETNIAAGPPIVDGPAAAPESFTAQDPRDAGRREMPERWSSWEEFRTTSPAVQRELMQLVARPLPDMRRMTTLPLPEDIPADLDGWSRPLGTIEIPGEAETISTGRRWLSIGLTIPGLVLMIYGGIDLLLDLRLTESIATWAGCGFLAFLFGLLLWKVPNAKLAATVWVFEEGLFFQRYGRSKVAAWTDIQEFEVSSATGRPLFWLTFSHDLSVAISAGFSPEVVPLMEYIEIRLAAAQLLRRLEAIWEGEPQRFGSVTLDRDGFRGSNFFAPWAEVRRVVSDAQNVFVDWSGASEWVALRYRDVSFPYLVMATSHVMIDEHARFPKS